MENDPRPRRIRGGRRRGGQPAPDRARPNRAPAQPKPPVERAVARRERPRRRPARSPDELRPGTACLIVMDCREGEPDRSGAAAAFEGFFDLETGDPRRAGYGVPRLRIVRPAQPDPAAALTAGAPEPPAKPETPAKVERVWGFECWWRPDPAGAGMTETDRAELEQSKKLLRGLVRDSRRAGRALGVRDAAGGAR